MMKKYLPLLFLLSCTFCFSQADTTFESVALRMPKDSLLNLAIMEVIKSGALIDFDTTGEYQKTIESNLNFAVDVIRLHQKAYGGNEDSYWWLGLALFYFHDYRAAIVEFNNAVGLNPNNFKNYEMRAECKQKLHDNYGAANDFFQAINRAPQTYARMEYLYAMRGGCLIDIIKIEHEDSTVEKNRVNEAISCYDKAISLNKKEGLYHFQKGMLLGIKGDLKAACLSLSKAGELGYSKAYEMIEAHCNSKH